MAGGTLPAVMPGWAGVTGLAVGRSGSRMVEGSRKPGIGIVTGRALGIPVIFRTGMAGLAVGRPGSSVIERGR